MLKQRIWIDSDPGLDDAAAILMAFGAPDRLSLEGISTVAGNVGLEAVTRNAQGLLALVGCTDIPVHAGCPQPLMSELVRAAKVHGEDGIGGVALPRPVGSMAPSHAIEAIDAFCRRGLETDKGTLVVTGPMTNVALAVVRSPDMLDRIERIVFMGGSALGPGNVTPAAEFNFASDPHAARIVLGADVPCVMMGLDVTGQAVVTPERVAALEAIGTAPAEALARMLTVYRGRTGKTLLHDPCTIAYILKPGLFDGKTCFVEVGCESQLSRGRCVADWHGVMGKPANATVMTELDADGFFDLLITTIAAV